MKSDRELIIDLQNGSLQALGCIYDRHQHLVYRTALAITGDGEVASDLLQDAFLRLHRFAHRVDPERPLEPWLYRATTNLAYTWVKRHKRWIQPIEDMADWLASGGKNSPSKKAEERESWNQVEKAIASLSLPHRVVVVLYYINDLSLQEISEIIDVPVGTVKSRLYYGRQALKEFLNKEDIISLPEVQYEFT